MYVFKTLFKLCFSIEEGLRVQALSRPQRVRKHATEPDLSRLETASNASSENTPLKRPKTLSDDSSAENSLAEATTESAPPPELPQPVGDIELIFRPLPMEHESPDDSQIRYIKTTANATGNLLYGKYANRNYPKLTHTPKIYQFHPDDL